MDSMQSLMVLAERCNVGLEGVEAEVRLQREVDLLQSYAELVRGMSGYVGGLLLVAGVPDEAAVTAAHHQGLQPADMAHLFPAQKPLCSFVPSRFKGAATTAQDQGHGLHSRKVGEQGDIDMASAKHLRGRQQHLGDDLARGSGARLSRSLSPNSHRHHHHQQNLLSPGLQGQAQAQAAGLLVSRTISERHVTQAPPYQDQPLQHSLVSDILTMFAGPVATRARADSKSNDRMYIEGSVSIRSAGNISEDICSFARGGLRAWFPLLIMDSPRQVATLRIIASLITSSTNVFMEFEAIAVRNVLLYCMYITPLLASEASLQVLFDLATQSRPTVAVTLSAPHAKNDLIHRVEFLILSIQIAASSPCNILLSLCTVEWLLGVCDDSLDNIAKVLDAVGLVPFLLMLSLWHKSEDLQLLEIGDVPSEEGAGALHEKEDEDEGGGTGRAEYTIRMPCASLSAPEKGRVLSLCRSVFSDSIHSDQPLKLARLQVTIARFLKLLITGSNGELPSIRVAAAPQSPTGFSVQHMQTLLNFISSCTME